MSEDDKVAQRPSDDDAVQKNAEGPVYPDYAPQEPPDNSGPQPTPRFDPPPSDDPQPKESEVSDEQETEDLGR